MTLDEAISRACADAGIEPPRGRTAPHRWINADTHGKHGKGDGRLIYDDQRVTAYNWQTAASATVWLEGREKISPADRAKYARDIAEAERKAWERAAHAAEVAGTIVNSCTTGRHAYLAAKGFPDEVTLLIGRDRLSGILEAARKKADSLVTVDGHTAIVIPARKGTALRSVQVIWEDGTKKFLAGGSMHGVCHRLARGRDTWLCEGYATGLSLRLALRGLGRADTVLVCFSASNIAKVSSAIGGRRYIATDHDKPLEHFGGIGTGEHYARESGAPYFMPAQLGWDINDLHLGENIFAVQRLMTTMLRSAA